jgi:hypothetical protein
MDVIRGDVKRLYAQGHFMTSALKKRRVVRKNHLWVKEKKTIRSVKYEG